MQKLLRIFGSLLIIAFLGLPLLLPVQEVNAAPPEILVGYTQGDLPSGFPLNLTTHVIIEYLTPATYADMTLTMNSTSDAEAHTLVTAIHAAGKKALMDIYTPWYDSSWNIFGNAALRADLIAAILVKMTHYDLDGIDFDWESQAQSNWSAANFNTFITALYAAMPAGKQIIMGAVGTNKAVFQAATVNTYFTSINVMAYDLATTWYGSQAQFQTALAYWNSTVGVNKAKITGGINTAWRGGSYYPDSWVKWKYVLAGYNPVTGYSNVKPSDSDVQVNAPNYDWGLLIGSSYNLAGTKAQWVKDNAYGGVMIYELNMDDYQSPKSITYKVYNTLFTSLPSPTPTPTPPPATPTATPTVPTTTTTAASYLSQTTARLNGNLTNMGTATSVSVNFEWGTATGVYTHTTTTQSRSVTGTFYAIVTGLTTGTPYFYRSKAVGASTVYGSEQTFTTLAGGDVPSPTPTPYHPAVEDPYEPVVPITTPTQLITQIVPIGLALGVIFTSARAMMAQGIAGALKAVVYGAVTYVCVNIVLNVLL